jgi:hypothetical protein
MYRAILEFENGKPDVFMMSVKPKRHTNIWLRSVFIMCIGCDLCLLSFFGGESARDPAQGFEHARQVLYHKLHPQPSYYFIYLFLCFWGLNSGPTP